MTAPNTTVWTHTNSSSLTGIVWQTTGNAFGTHAISGGGYANGLDGTNATSTDEGGNDVSPSCPLVGSFPSYDPGTDTTYWMLGFQAPPGATLRVHIFAILA